MNKKSKKISYYVLSLIIAIFLILITFKSMPDSKPKNTNQPEPIRYVALGDSYTIGQGINTEDSWPNVLTKDINQKGLNIELVANPSRTGWTTQNLIDSELPIFIKSKPTFATLLIGVNDWVQGVSKEKFRDNFIFILNEVEKELPNKTNFVVVTIPDFSVTPTGKLYNNGRDISKGISEFNQIIKEEAQKKSYQLLIFSLLVKIWALTQLLLLQTGYTLLQKNI
jgi:acyl-CoA thioesterase-1